MKFAYNMSFGCDARRVSTSTSRDATSLSPEKMKRIQNSAIIFAVSLAIGHFFFLFLHCPPSFPGPDANGYFVQAALLVKNGQTSLAPESPLSYIGRHWLETADGRFFSRYPPGVGVLVAAPYAVFGPETGLYLMPLLASLTVLLLFLICRSHAGGWFALGAALVYAVHPTANQQALNWGGHTAVTFFLVLGLWLIISWARSPKLWKAVIAGLLLGAIPSLRYAEAVAGIGFAVFMFYHVMVFRRDRWRDLIVAFVGFAVPVGFLMWRNTMAFDGPLTTGYGLTGEQQWGSGFSVVFFKSKWLGYVEMLMGPGMGLFFAFALAGLVTLCVRRRTRGLGILLSGVILSISLVYTAYYVGRGSSDWLRFLLPILPLFMVAAICFIYEHGKSAAAYAAFAFILLAQVGLWLPETLNRISQTARNLEAMATVIQFVRDKVPAGGVLIADRRLQENLMYYPGLKLADAGFIRSVLRGSMRDRRPAGIRHPAIEPRSADADRDSSMPGDIRRQRANPRQHGKASRLREHYFIENPEKRASLLAMDLRQLAGNPPALYWIGHESQLDIFKKLLTENERFVMIGEVELPGEPEKKSGRRRGGLRQFGGGRYVIVPGTELKLYRLQR